MSLIMGADLAGMAASNAALLAPELVAIEGGTFTMGSSVFEDATPHEVEVSSFKMSPNPITNDQYRRLPDLLRDNRFALIGADPQTGVEKLLALGSSALEAQSALSKMPMAELLPSAGDMAVGGAARLVSSLTIAHIPDHDSPFKRPGQPAVMVSWHDAFVWAALHAAQLPGEAQTEYASYVAKYDTVAPAGGYPTVNIIRVLAAEGWEWQRDWYGPYPERKAVDPTGPVAGETKVLRGGFWDGAFPSVRRAARRSGYRPGDRYGVIGFRVVVPEGSIRVA